MDPAVIPILEMFPGPETGAAFSTIPFGRPRVPILEESSR